MEIKFDAFCATSISRDEGSRWVLLVFTGHLGGVLPIELGKLEQDVEYEVILRKKVKA